jgi:hypothetical protein
MRVRATDYFIYFTLCVLATGKQVLLILYKNRAFVRDNTLCILLLAPT